MPLKRIASSAALVLVLALSGQPAGAAHALAERTITLDEAVARAERQYKARAVRAEEERQGDRIVYRIRLLDDDGRVFEVRIDAATGRGG